MASIRAYDYSARQAIMARLDSTEALFQPKNPA